MYCDVAYGLLVPFLGTSLGAAMVFLLRREIAPWLQKLLLGFASEVISGARCRTPISIRRCPKG